MDLSEDMDVDKWYTPPREDMLLWTKSAEFARQVEANISASRIESAEAVVQPPHPVIPHGLPTPHTPSIRHADVSAGRSNERSSIFQTMTQTVARILPFTNKAPDSTPPHTPDARTNLYPRLSPPLASPRFPSASIPGAWHQRDEPDSPDSPDSPTPRRQELPATFPQYRPRQLSPSPRPRAMRADIVVMDEVRDLESGVEGLRRPVPRDFAGPSRAVGRQAVSQEAIVGSFDSDVAGRAGPSTDVALQVVPPFGSNPAATSARTLETPGLSRVTAKMTISYASTSDLTRRDTDMTYTTVASMSTPASSVPPSPATGSSKRLHAEMQEGEEDEEMVDESPAVKRFKLPERLPRTAGACPSTVRGQKRTSDVFGGPPVEPSGVQDTPCAAHAAPVVKDAPYTLAPFESDADRRILECMKDLPFGFKWEACRVISEGLMTWDELGSQVGELFQLRDTYRSNESLGNTAIVPRISSFIPEGRKHRYRTRGAVWKELDLEEQLINDGKGLELGNPNDPKDNQFGGKVRFDAVLKPRDPSKPKNLRDCDLELKLLPASVNTQNSNRFTRKFGSRAFLTVSVDDAFKDNDDFWTKFFSRGIMVAGQLYNALGSKDGKVFCVTAASQRTRRKMSDEDYWHYVLNWHNDPELDLEQGMGKWATRNQLGLSISFPGPRLDPNHMLEAPDIIAEPYRDMPGKPPNEAIMTDGAGWMTSRVARDIKARMGLSYIPCAVQHRTNGAKGLYVLCPPEFDVPYAQVWTRPSQIKIKHRQINGNDASLCTVDVLQASGFTSPSKLTSQLIINLAENGVPHGVLSELMKDSVKKAVAPFMNPDAHSLELCAAIENLCHLVAGRLRQTGRALARGAGPAQVPVEGESPEHPSSFEESAHACLLTDFSTFRSLYLFNKIKHILKNIVDCRVGDFKFPVDRSLDGLLVPDPLGVLEEGEIFVQYYEHHEVSEDEVVKILEGDVLVTRHPCMLPTDIRKVRAVDRPELHYLYGVIVFSIKGSRSLASILAGGDYDGDRGTVIWEPTLVAPFRNADISFASPPPGFKECLKTSGETAGAFRARVKGFSSAAKRRALQQYLLAELSRDYRMQKYSKLHDVALYYRGYFDEVTVLLAHRYNIELDGPKSCIRVKDEVFALDKRKWDIKHPWKPGQDYGTSNFVNTPTRPDEFGLFILKRFMEVGNKLNRTLARQYEMIRNPDMWRVKEEALCQPWLEFEARVSEESHRVARDAIVSHVRQCWHMYEKLIQKIGGDEKTRRNSNAEKEAIRLFFQSGPAASTWRDCMDEAQRNRLRASYAYIYDFGHNKTWKGQFPFDVAHWDMCEIKAKASGGTVTICLSSYYMVTINKRLIRHFSESTYSDY